MPMRRPDVGNPRKRGWSVNNQPVLIDKVKWDAVRVRVEYQQLRFDNRYDELVIGSFDVPSLEFQAALQALEADVIEICALPVDYTEGLKVRSVSFTYSDATMGAVITALKVLKTAKGPLVINTPYLTETGVNESDPGPFLPDATIERLRDLVQRAVGYIGGGERIQQNLDLTTEAPYEPPSGDVAAASALRAKDAAEYARLVGIDIGQAMTDPNNPAIRDFAHKFKNCSITVGGRTLSIDGEGHITASDTP